MIKINYELFPFLMSLIITINCKNKLFIERKAIERYIFHKDIILARTYQMFYINSHRNC